MENIDIKNIWQATNQGTPPEKKFTMEDIQKYRMQKSQQTSTSNRLAILFDIGYKSVALMMLISLLIFFDNSAENKLIIGLLLSITAFLILWEFSFINKVKSIRETDSVMANLKNKLDYLKSTRQQFMTLSALSNPLFVLAGFFLYHHFKYQAIRFESPIDLLVMLAFLGAAFAISYFAQKPVYKKQIDHLAECIEEMDDADTATAKIQAVKKHSRKNKVLYSVLILLGIMVLAMLILAYLKN